MGLEIIIKDELMGSGKSTRMIKEINNDVDENSRYIIVLPYLAECHRYAGTISTGESQSPKKDNKGRVIYTGGGCNLNGRRFHHPSSYLHGKLFDLERLVRAGRDIVTTHATLKNFSKQTAEFIKDMNYTLVIDEELECIKIYKGLTKTRKDLLFGKYIEVDPVTNRLMWIGGAIDTPKGDWVTECKNLCDSGSLFYLNDTVLVWEYPVEFLQAFKKVIILTYMFEGSMFASYLKHHGLNYTVNKMPRPEKDWSSLINILDHPKLNMIGDNETALSASWFKRHTAPIDSTDSTDSTDSIDIDLANLFNDKEQDAAMSMLHNSVYNYFNNYHRNISASKKMWSVFKDAYKHVKGKGYTKSHVPYNCKALNDYMDRYVLAYCVNVYLNPIELNYMQDWDYKPDVDVIALSTMLQWLFRSRIRKGEPIDIYVPSSRMRKLLLRWIECEEIHFNTFGYQKSCRIGKTPHE